MFYITSCPAISRRKSPNGWIAADSLATSCRPAAGKEKKRVAGSRINYSGRPTEASATASTITTGTEAGSNLYHLSFDDRVLARECLKEIGRELGVPR